MVDVGIISASARRFAVTLMIQRKNSKSALSQHASQLLKKHNIRKGNEIQVLIWKRFQKDSSRTT